jgi:hypothetical protein
MTPIRASIVAPPLSATRMSASMAACHSGAECSAFDSSMTAITTKEATWFRAGRDIRGIDYGLRNIRTTDASLLEAGNDIIGGGMPDPARLLPNGVIHIEGPGALVMSAGRDVYGRTLQLFSTGNRNMTRTAIGRSSSRRSWVYPRKARRSR